LEKAPLDFGYAASLASVVESDGPDYLEMIQQLCVAAGMIMEDASSQAVQLARGTRRERNLHIEALTHASADAAALLLAADALNRRFADPR
jgi:hypothetical protein